MFFMGKTMKKQRNRQDVDMRNRHEKMKQEEFSNCTWR